MNARSVLIALVVLSISISGVIAQDPLVEKKKENIEYYLLTCYKFKDGSAEYARDLIKNIFLPVATEIGWEPIIFDPLMTGSEWDMMVFFHLKDGLSQLEYEVSKFDILFFNRLMEKEKMSDPEGQNKLADLRNLIAIEKTEIMQRLMPKK